MKPIHRYIVIPIDERDNRAWSYPFVSQAHSKELELKEIYGEGKFIVTLVTY